jgi:hypothetical protein
MLVLSTVHGDWPLVDAGTKLRLRAKLPGASAFDDAAFGLRAARARGVPATVLLAPAMAGSWLVNSAIPSPLMQRWLAPGLREEWERLVAALEAGDAPDSSVVDDANVVDDALVAITGATAGAGASLGAVSKVLSLVSTAPIPLMPDAALAHVLRALPIPERADAQTAPTRFFAPMLARVRESTARSAGALATLAESVAPSLRPADVIDRLLWFDSVGYRHFRGEQGGWYWVRSEADEAVVFVPGPAPARWRPGACVEVPGEDDFSARAGAAVLESLSRG